MDELKRLIDASGMSLRDFSYAIGVRHTRVARMLSGEVPTPMGVIAVAHQLNADIDYVEALLDAKPELKNINYKVFKLLLDEGF